MAVNGNDILVLMNGTAVAHARTSEIQVDGEVIEISSPSQGQWREFIAGRKEWSVKLDYLVFFNTNMKRLVTVGTTVTLMIKGRNASDSYGLTGRAIITAAAQTYTRGKLIAGSFTFSGASALTNPT